MKTRIITGILIALVALPALYLGDIFFNLLMLAIVIIAGYEMVHIASRPRFKFYLYPLIMVFSWPWILFLCQSSLHIHIILSDFIDRVACCGDVR